MCWKEFTLNPLNNSPSSGSAGVEWSRSTSEFLKARAGTSRVEEPPNLPNSIGRALEPLS